MASEAVSLDDAKGAVDRLLQLRQPAQQWELAWPRTTAPPEAGDRFVLFLRRHARSRGMHSARTAAVEHLGWVAGRHHQLQDPVRRAAVHAHLRAALPQLVRWITDRDPAVRQAAPYTIWQIGPEGDAVLEAIRAQAAVERDPTALYAQLRALDQMDSGRSAALPRGCFGDERHRLPADVVAAGSRGGWYLPWLAHRVAEVRLAAAAAYARCNPPQEDTVDLAAVIAGALFRRRRRRSVEEFQWGPLNLEAFFELLADRPDQCLRLVLTASTDSDSRIREAVPPAAALILAGRRAAPQPLLDALGTALTADTGRTRSEAAGLLAAVGTVPDPGTGVVPAAGFAAELRHLGGLGDQWGHDTLAGVSAVGALAGLRDPTVPDLVLRWFAGTLPHWVRVAVLPTVLAPFRDRAADLVPAVRAALRRDSAGPGFADHLPKDEAAVIAYVRILAAWGPASADAVPDLAALLDTRAATVACRALGAIGPAAAGTAGVLRDLARGEHRPSGGGRTRRRHGSRDAAWAHWRVTGDPAVALDVIGRALGRSPGRGTLLDLADLGPLAATYAGRVRLLLAGGGPRVRVEAAHAWWRCTGDPAAAVPVLLDAVRPLSDGHSSTLVRSAIRHLGAIGVPAAAAVPLLQEVLAAERRYSDPDRSGDRFDVHLDTIRGDIALMAEARTALDRITAEPRPSAVG